MCECALVNVCVSLTYRQRVVGPGQGWEGEGRPSGPPCPPGSPSGGAGVDPHSEWAEEAGEYEASLPWENCV